MAAKGHKTSATDVIGTWLGWDVNDVRDQIYQPGPLNPSVYVIGEDYACCPPAGRKPPVKDRDGQDRGFVWKPVFEWHGRTVFLSKLEDMK